MDRYARRQHFERIVSLRDAYSGLDALDTMSVMSIDEAIAYGNDLFDHLEATAPDGATDAGQAIQARGI